MRETNPPPSSSGGNKVVLLLLVGGTIILAVALVILFKKRTEPTPKDTEPPQIAQTVKPAAPLVVAQPTRPILTPEEPDGGTESNETKSKTGRKRRSEKIGSIDPKEVNSFMNARFGQVKACYERRLKMNSLLEGKLDLNIDISPVGKVTAVTVNRDTLRDSQMLDCVKRAIRSWDFPKPKGGRVIIGKTFNFKKKMK